MRLSCALAPTMQSPEHIECAETLGYSHAWLFDTPQQSPDVWTILGLAATRTHSIGLGPGVAVPSLRHPVVTAAATQTLASLAPGRVAVAFGTGYTSRKAMGQEGVTWNFLRHYVETFRDLVQGEETEWEGSPVRLLDSPDGFRSAAADVPIVIAATGPRGGEEAKSMNADGLMNFGTVSPGMANFDWTVLLVGGRFSIRTNPSTANAFAPRPAPSGPCNTT